MRLVAHRPKALAPRVPLVAIAARDDAANVLIIGARVKFD